MKKLKMQVAVIKCRRCGSLIHTPEFSLFNAQKQFIKYYDICKKCITPDEIREIDKAIKERAEHAKPRDCQN